MANITFDRDFIDADHGFAHSVDRVLRRLRVLVRFHRISRVTRAHLALLRAERHDPRLLEDVGLKSGSRQRLDWIGTIALALGGRL